MDDTAPLDLLETIPNGVDGSSSTPFSDLDVIEDENVSVPIHESTVQSSNGSKSVLVENNEDEPVAELIKTEESLVSSKKRKSKRRSDGYNKSRKRSKSSKSEEYEVEMIVDHKIEDGQEYYLVKWKGWTEDYDSWVNKSDLHCPALVNEFFRLQKGKADEPDPAAVAEQLKADAEAIELQAYMETILKPTAEDVEFAIQLVCSGSEKRNGIKGNMSSEDLQKFACQVYKKKQQLVQMERTLMMQRLTNEFRQRRTAQQELLKEWEKEINAITKGWPPVKIENLVDLEEPPVGFSYVNQCKAGDGVVIPDDPVIGCDCTDCIDNRKTCCGPMSGSSSAYTKAGKLKVPVGTPIYECNSRCKCGPECPNRVVQRGSKLKLCIFRTNNGRGWGVKTLETIRKNSFVIEYVGEVITNEEAEKRGVQYDSEGRTYLFDLDFNDIDCMYSVDAAHYGNVAHFVNHSCDPNLAVYAMWSNCMDPNMPRLALFAQRDIHSGEELTFDYASSKTGSVTLTENGNAADGETVEEVATVTNECRCGAATCRKVMFSVPLNRSVAPYLNLDQSQ